MEDGEPLVQRAPIARLPAELVTGIINIIAHDSVHGRWDDYLPDESIAISHVCKFWRDAALGSGGKVLWTRAPLRHSAACVRAFMERSHPLPVFLSVELGDDSIPTSMAALAEAATFMDRVEGLSVRSVYHRDTVLSAADRQLHESLHTILSTNIAPSLKTLAWWHEYDMGYDGQPTLPAKLFAEHIPDNLRSVKIVGMALPHEFAALRAPLTSLDLGNCEAWEYADELLDTLSCMPGLESFIFDAANTSWCSNRWPQRYEKRSVALPCLRTLCLTDQPAGVSSHLLAYLRIPVDARIHVEATPEEITPQNDMAQFCQALFAHYHENALPDGQTFTFSTISIGLCGGNSDGLTLHASYRNAPCLSLVVAEAGILSTGSRAVILETVQTILRFPVMAHATQFNISHSNYFAMGNESDWGALQTSFPDLNTICLSRTALYGLAPTLLQPHAPHSGIIIFPSLTSLLFEGLTFVEGDLPAAFYFNALKTVADHRASQGHPLKHIEFRTCSGAATLAQQLSIALPDVQVTHRWGSQNNVLIGMKATQWDHGYTDIHDGE
ncbi:hypothetical protein PENSPDRAFT_648969 [Peniophora sp. CONT]|nr:hypothetical protein PENSPDRAFT_648969 [Peniophora sp. CONT]